MIRLRITPVHPNCKFTDPAVWWSTGFGSGLIRPAPGTWGSAVGIALTAALKLSTPYPQALWIILILFTLTGVWMTKRYQTLTAQHDASEIVVDEICGVMLAVCVSGTFTPLSYLLCFLLFRLFDIWKPLFIGYADAKIPGAWGVMVDDLLAGLVAGLIALGVFHVLG